MWENICHWLGGAKEDWMEATKKKNTKEEKYKFVTSVLSKMKLSIEHRKKQK